MTKQVNIDESKVREFLQRVTDLCHEYGMVIHTCYPKLEFLQLYGINHNQSDFNELIDLGSLNDNYDLYSFDWVDGHYE